MAAAVARLRCRTSIPSRPRAGTWLPDFRAFASSVLGWNFSSKGYPGSGDSPIAMVTTAGRPFVAALRLLLSQTRLLSLPRDKRFAALLAESRRFQNEVSERLAEQVLHALSGLRAIYNTLVAASVTRVAERPPADGWRVADPTLDRAQRIDASLRGCAPNGWRGFLPKEQEVAPDLPSRAGHGDGRTAVRGHQGPGGVLMRATLRLGELRIHVVRKDIRNVHLSVHPPNGRTRIAAPRHLSDAAIRAFAIGKLGWIRAQQQKLQEQERETPREYLDRESHFVWGRRCLLRVVEHEAPPVVEWRQHRLTLSVRPNTPRERRAEILEAWYRAQLRAAAAPLVELWQKRLDVRLPNASNTSSCTSWRT